MLNPSDFGARDDGAASIEYALVAALIAVVLIGSLKATGSALDKAYGTIGSAVSGAGPSGG